MEQTNNKQPEEKKRNLIAYIISFIELFIKGGILKEDFVVKQSTLIIMIACCFVLFIGNRYACMKEITQIEDLKKELTDAKCEHLVALKKLTTDSRQTQIKALIETKRLDLSDSNSPVYLIEK